MNHFKAQKWIELFLSLKDKSKGYQKKNITPYMHSMVYHAPFFMAHHCGLSKFTGQGKIIFLFLHFDHNVLNLFICSNSLYYDVLNITDNYY